jgi:hypothetical protein
MLLFYYPPCACHILNLAAKHTILCPPWTQ